MPTEFGQRSSALRQDFVIRSWHTIMIVCKADSATIGFRKSLWFGWSRPDIAKRISVAEPLRSTESAHSIHCAAAYTLYATQRAVHTSCFYGFLLPTYKPKLTDQKISSEKRTSQSSKTTEKKSEARIMFRSFRSNLDYLKDGDFLLENLAKLFRIGTIFLAMEWAVPNFERFWQMILSGIM